MVNEILSIGIDLGTSRSVVCASNDQREWVDSYVGWPKDFIARRTLGNRVLFGADALDHRLSLDLVRPLANGVIREGTERDEEAVRELVGARTRNHRHRLTGGKRMPRTDEELA
jgi:rod shape-determining protein MreB